MTTSADVRHRENCRRHDVHPTVGRLGDDLLRCRGCAAFVVVSPEAEDTPAPPPLTPIVSRYRCRDHDNPVNPWGRGCAQCAADHARPRKSTTREEPQWLL